MRQEHVDDHLGVQVRNAALNGQGHGPQVGGGGEEVQVGVVHKVLDKLLVLLAHVGLILHQHGQRLHEDAHVVDGVLRGRYNRSWRRVGTYFGMYYNFFYIYLKLQYQ